MSEFHNPPWTKWSDKRPPNERGKHRYRATANILGLTLTPEWTEAMHLCGMGHAESEWWPLSPCRWDGYRRYMTNSSLEWRDLREDDPDRIFWGGLDLLPCPFTGEEPVVTAQGRWIGAPLWESEALWICSSAVPKTRWIDAAAMVASWNRRAVVKEPGE